MIRQNTSRSLLKGAAFLAIGAALASCSGHGSSMMIQMTPTPAPDAFAVFGIAFATDFQDGVVSPIANPVVPAAGDLVALSLTTDPVNPLPAPAS